MVHGLEGETLPGARIGRETAEQLGVDSHAKLQIESA
jgi:hypothetical protein